MPAKARDLQELLNGLDFGWCGGRGAKARRLCRSKSLPTKLKYSLRRRPLNVDVKQIRHRLFDGAIQERKVLLKEFGEVEAY